MADEKIERLRRAVAADPGDKGLLERLRRSEARIGKLFTIYFGCGEWVAYPTRIYGIPVRTVRHKDFAEEFNGEVRVPGRRGHILPQPLTEGFREFADWKLGQMDAIVLQPSGGRYWSFDMAHEISGLPGSKTQQTLIYCPPHLGTPISLLRKRVCYKLYQTSKELFRGLSGLVMEAESRILKDKEGEL